MFFRPLPLKEKVCIISRQADEPTLDIKLLDQELKRQGAETVVLTKTLKKNLKGMLSYSLQMIRQMYHIATSKVIVVDGYCILVSVLPKKKNQQVVQMWHALGAIKKFGWQNVENPDGHGREVAEAMCMHRNYDYVLAPGARTGKYFAEAFRTPEERVVFYGLPRIDFLRTVDEKQKKEMEERYPEIVSKINILYVPTFRKNAEVELERLVAQFDFAHFNLIIKKHFLDRGDYGWAKEAGAIVDESYSSIEWLRICEKVITDYSAMAFEAAILEKDLYIFQPDVAKYEQNVGLNVEMKQEAIADYVFCEEGKLLQSMKEPYDREKVIAFRKKYIEIELEGCTKRLSEFLLTLFAK